MREARIPVLVVVFFCKEGEEIRHEGYFERFPRLVHDASNVTGSVGQEMDIVPLQRADVALPQSGCDIRYTVKHGDFLWFSGVKPQKIHRIPGGKYA